MQTLLEKFCFSDRDNGLLLVDMPTGTGKTYNAVEFIYENYQDVKNKIIFITNLKKNLPFNDLRKKFQKDNRLDEFNKNVLFLDNNVDTLIENFNKVEKFIPKDIFGKNGTLYNVKRCVNIINTIKENLKNPKSKAVTEEFGSKENAYFIMSQAKEDLKERYEQEFRLIIEDELKYDGNGKRRTKAEKLELIKTNPNYKWISTLYPAVNTDDKKILFMSIDKFLVKNSTIIEPSYSIIDNKSLLKKSIIFIDEFDSSKDVILKSIIKESLNTKVSVVELFRMIYSGLKNTEFSKLLIEVSGKLKTDIEQHPNYYTPDAILEEFKNKAEEIETKYKLANFHKLDAAERERANFLFQDYEFHTVLSDEKSCICIENDKDTRVNWIKKTDHKNITEEKNIFILLQSIKSFLSYFQNGIKLIADNYLALKRQRKQETNNFSYEAAVKTVLSEFGIEGKYLNYLTSQIFNSRKAKTNKIVDLKNELDFSVYEKGFRFYNFIDSDVFDTQSKIQLLSFDMSPEKILIYLCLNAKVIGISASGTLETVTGNYDLSYIKKKLGPSFYELNMEEKNRIDKYITRKLGNYSNVNIDVDKCPINNENYYDVLKSVLLGDDYKEISEKINFYTSENFVKARYCKLVYAINNFFKKNIHSFLFLTNVSMGSSPDFNNECIKFIFETLKPSNCDDAYYYSLEGSLEKFENMKRAVKDKLKDGKKVFVISTYQTLGAGQNLQYEYDENYEGVLNLINDDVYEKKYKDFDALFLDKPTNLFVNMNSKPSEEGLLKFIYQVKSLEEVGHFDVDEATAEIKKGIKILYHASTQKINTPRSKHIYMHTAKTILQAIGRICRTNTKTSNIYISFDQQMETELAYCKDDLLKRPINNEFRALLSKCESYKTEIDEKLLNINNSKITKIDDKIGKLLKFNSPSDIVKWEELRDVVLKYPYDNIGIHNDYDIYYELENIDDYYFYNRNGKHEFNITCGKYNDYCVSETRANLKSLMLINGVKEYFELNGYAPHFEKSHFLLLPNVFDRIYLGALGEVVGSFLVNNFLANVGLKLERIKNLDRYEKFDFVFDNNKYVDFKYWNGNRDKDREREVERIMNKLDKCNGTYGYIINILKPQNYNPKDYISPDSRLTIIPYLYDQENNKMNLDGLNLLLLHINVDKNI